MIAVRFACGHERQLTGGESHPRCACGETTIANVVAQAPRFRGHALGPCSIYEDLPAQPLTLKSEPKVPHG